MSISTITARSSLPGLHAWPSAPERRAYLRTLHRHVFGIEVRALMGHADRDIEFHDLAERSRSLLASMGEQYHPDSTLVSFGSRSCESLAAALGYALQDLGVDVISVTISEDGENDGTWEPGRVDPGTVIDHHAHDRDDQRPAMTTTEGATA